LSLIAVLAATCLQKISRGARLKSTSSAAVGVVLNAPLTHRQDVRWTLLSFAQFVALSSAVHVLVDPISTHGFFAREESYRGFLKSFGFPA